MADDEILTIREVAALLKIGEKTAYTMAQAGELPGFKVRGQWRFRRSDLDDWITRNVESSRNPADAAEGDDT
jgi:excisionase family DNA binding protein